MTEFTLENATLAIGAYMKNGHSKEMQFLFPLL